jgi:peptidoglycan hydrolase-like protein with peptidoglycan-binding domain
LTQLETFWTRNAIVGWREEPGIWRAGRMEAWARERLATQGYEAASLAAAVRRFQEDAGLISDGRLGPRTRMALFSRYASDRPRIVSEDLP